MGSSDSGLVSRGRFSPRHFPLHPFWRTGGSDYRNRYSQTPLSVRASRQVDKINCGKCALWFDGEGTNRGKYGIVAKDGFGPLTIPHQQVTPHQKSDS